MSKYIIINADTIQKKIEELKVYKDEPEIVQLKVYEEILSQSTPLIPEIEKAFDEGQNSVDAINIKIEVSPNFYKKHEIGDSISVIIQATKG